MLAWMHLELQLVFKGFNFEINSYYKRLIYIYTYIHIIYKYIDIYIYIDMYIHKVGLRQN